MRFSRRILLFLVAAFGLAVTALAQSNFQLRDGDTVVFYGDSITDQRLYTSFTESYVLTRFPRLRIRFVHSGVGGDRVTGGSGGPIDLRLSRDVVAYHPTVMTIMLGMNDGSYRAWDDALFKTYSEGYEHIIDSMKKSVPGFRITVIEPSPYDDVTRPPTFEGGYNTVLVRYGQYVKQLGERNGLVVADLNAPVVAMLEKTKAADPDVAQRIIPDRVHPGEGGHLIMAEALLKAWNAPATVASMEIDAASGRVVHAESTKWSDLFEGPGEHPQAGSAITWTQTDEALPFPLPQPLEASRRAVGLAIRSSDFVEALDQEPLKVTGLAASRYALSIDGEKIGDFTREELAAGINLAVLPTPMAKQAATVHELTVKHNQIHFARWRQVQVSLQDFTFASEPAALDALDKLEDEIVQEQRATSQPKARHYALTPE
jgi:lysophospholipase L1-like esterase